MCNASETHGTQQDKEPEIEKTRGDEGEENKEVEADW